MSAARTFRRVLRAYPQGPRRDELLDTLLAARVTPGPRIFLNLLRHGLRARLGRPAGRLVVVTAVLVAMTTGLGVAAIAARIAWTAVPDYPAGARLAEITGTVFPDAPVDGRRSTDGLFFDVTERSGAQVALYGHDEDFEFASYEFGPAGRFVAGGYREWTNAAATRLEADGWTVKGLEPTGATITSTGRMDVSGREFWAFRDGLSLHFAAETAVVDTPPGSFEATATLARLTPIWVTAAAGAGWLLGAVAGWLLTGFVSRRTEWATPGARAAAHGTAGLALVVALPGTLMGTLGLVAEPFLHGATGYKPFWWLSLTYGFACTWLAAVLGVTAAGIAMLAGRREARAGAAEWAADGPGAA
jgi:hypothetical protein